MNRESHNCSVLDQSLIRSFLKWRDVSGTRQPELFSTVFGGKATGIRRENDRPMLGIK